MHVGRVVVGVSGSPGSLGALRYAAEMARGQNSILSPVLAWTPPGGDLADRRCPNPYLRAVWKQAAWDRLWRAVDLALGGPPDGVAFSPDVVRGEPGAVLAQVVQPSDVLVIGAGRQGALRRLMACRVGRYCMAHACCPVIAMPPARMAAEVHGLHGWVLRRRMHPEDADLHAADA
jgi:nucleotide-binding universal stress UspA family protein